MIRNIFTVAIAVLGVATACAQPQDSIRTHVNLHITDRPDTKEAYLLKADADFRFGILKVVKFEDGQCSFDFVAEAPFEMELMFDDELRQGMWVNKRFYAEGDTVSGFFGSGSESVRFESAGAIQAARTRLNEDIDKATGGMEMTYLARLNEMERTGEMVNEEIRPLYLQMKEAKDEERDSLRKLIAPIYEKYDNDIETEAYKQLYQKLLGIWQKQDTLRWNYLADSDPSLFGLMEIRRILSGESSRINIDEAIARIERTFNERYGGFSTHPYYDECKLMFTTRLLRPGRKYDADYKLHDQEGNEAVMADLIKGRYAVIDLWASWCGPCRRNSMALIPVYNKYVDRGLSYVAVAREMGNTKSMNIAMERDGYPWKSFVDINDADGIWAKNGCPTSGGSIFLIDADGVIVAVNPTAEFIDKYLDEHLAK